MCLSVAPRMWHRIISFLAEFFRSSFPNPLLSAVMLLGVTVLRKKYPLAKYLCVLLIVTGVALFMYKPKKGSASADDHIFGYGELLLVSTRLLKYKESQGFVWVVEAAPPSGFSRIHSGKMVKGVIVC